MSLRYSSNRVYYAVIKSGGKIFRRSLKTAERKLATLKKARERITPDAGRLTMRLTCDVTSLFRAS